MNQGIGAVGLPVDDQDEALALYVGKAGFRAPSGNDWNDSGRTGHRLSRPS